jgi:hypothetical protein
MRSSALRAYSSVTCGEALHISNKRRSKHQVPSSTQAREERALDTDAPKASGRAGGNGSLGMIAALAQ